MVLTVVMGGSTPADQIDLALVRESNYLTRAIQDLGAKSVAALKFQVQIGNNAPTFSAGTLGGDMAQRVENLLTLCLTPEAPELEVLTGAGEAAAKHAAALKEAIDWTTPSGRAKLFALQLPVLWDAKRELPPDAFVTGTVRVAEDLKTLTIDIVAFTKNDATNLRPVYTVGAAKPIPTDRNILSAMGRTFAIPTRVVTARGGDLRVLNEIAAAENRERTERQTGEWPGPVKLQIFYDNAEVKPSPGPDGEFRVPTPKAGQSIKFLMTNVSSEPVAALLTVNGKNTLALDGKTEDLAAPSARLDKFQLWVLEEPNKPYAVNGFLTSLDGTFKPFQVLSESASVRAFQALSPVYAGKIQLTVFGKQPILTPPTASEKPTLKEEWPTVAATPQKPEQPPTVKEPTVAEPKPAEQPDDQPRTLKADEDAVRELNDGHAAGALLVRLQLGDSGDLAKAQFVMKRGLGLNRAKDGSLLLPQVTRGFVEAGKTEQSGSGTRMVRFQRDPAPLANVVIAYYNPYE
jgi:hypothetical protein